MDRGFLRLSIAVLLLGLMGCHHSGDSAGAPDVEGTWQGHFTAAGPAPSPVTYIPGSYPLVGAIVKGYYGFLYTSEGDFFELPAMADKSTFAGTGTEYWSCGSGDGVFCNFGAVNVGPTGGDYPFQATVGSDTFDASLTYVVMRNSSCILSGLCTSVPNSSFTLARSAPYSGTPQLIPGAWQGNYYGTGTGPNINVNSDGTFTGNDPVCAITGTITQMDNSNIFAITMTRQLNCNQTGVGHFIGAGYLVDTGTGIFTGVPGTYFVMGYSDGDQAYVVQFKVH